MNISRKKDELNNSHSLNVPYKKPSMQSVIIEPRRVESKNELRVFTKNNSYSKFLTVPQKDKLNKNSSKSISVQYNIEKSQLNEFDSPNKIITSKFRHPKTSLHPNFLSNNIDFDFDIGTFRNQLNQNEIYSQQSLNSKFEIDNVSPNLYLSPVRKINPSFRKSESAILNIYNIKNKISKSDENDISLQSINLNKNNHHRVNTNLTSYLNPFTDYSIVINDEYIRSKSEIISSNKNSSQDHLNSEYLINSIQNLGNLMKKSSSINQKILNEPENKIKVDCLNNLLNQNLESKINISNSRFKELNDELEKERVVQEIFVTSDQRLKKYDTLFEFIHENIQGMAEIVSRHGSSMKSNNHSSSVSKKNIIPKPEDFNPFLIKDFLNSEVVHIKNKSHFSSSDSIGSDEWVGEIEKENLEGLDPQTITSFRSRTNLSNSMSQNEIKNDLNYFRSKTCESLLLNNDNKILNVEPNYSTNEKIPKKKFLQNTVVENDNIKIGVFKTIIEANSYIFLDCKDVLLEYHNLKMRCFYHFMFNELNEQSKKYKDLKYVQEELEEEKNSINKIIKSKVDDINQVERIEFLFLKSLKCSLNKLNGKLETYNYKKSKNNKDKIQSAIHQINYILKNLNGYEENIITSLDINEMLHLVVSEFNGLYFDTFDSSKTNELLENLIKGVFFKYKLEKCNAKKIISNLKNEVFSLTQLIDPDNDKELHLNLMSNIISIRLVFDALESLSISNNHHIKDSEIKPINKEIFYIPRKEFDNFKLISEKEASKINVMSYLCMKIFSKNKLEINYGNQNLFSIKDKNSQLRKIEFFGLPLRLNYNFLNISHNVILHISGGGLSSNLLENETDYLKKWVNETNSIVFSFNYKVKADTKLQNIIESYSKAYELIVSHSVSLFNFNLEKLIVYSDSTGCAITFEIIKYAGKNKIRLPDSIILMHPNCNVSIDDLLYSNDPHYLEDVFEPSHRSRYNTNIYLDTIKDEERLNLFLIENKVLQFFPKTLVISAENEFLFDDCSKLVSFLKSHNVQVETRHLIYYSEGHFYFPSYLDSEFIVSLNFIYNYIKQELRKN